MTLQKRSRPCRGRLSKAVLASAALAAATCAPHPSLAPSFTTPVTGGPRRHGLKAASAARAEPAESTVLEASSAAYESLAATPLRRASDGSEVALPSLWGPGERIVVVFLRHFGWMACWELGLQLKRDWLPELQKTDTKLLVVGIGTAESARAFAEQIGLPASDVFADDEASAYQAVRMVNSDFEEDGRQRGMRMLTGKTIEAVKGRANGRPLSFFGLFDIPFLYTNDDLEAAKEIYKPLMPQGDNSMDKTLVQGGMFIFKGDQQVFRHRDASVAVHADLNRVLEAVNAAA